MLNSTDQQVFTVRPEEAGLRLDYFLRVRNQELSQRTCKRLCQSSLVLINGKPAKPGQPLRANDMVLLNPPHKSDNAPDLYAQVTIVQAQNGLYAIKKPAGLHSVSIQGSGNPNLEECLQLRWAELWDDWSERLATAQTIYPFEEAGAGQGFCASSADAPLPPLPQLLNRLDQDTSGLVMAAGTPEARQRYLSAEETWQIAKNYMALVHGILEQPLTLTNTLRSQSKTRMRAKDYADMNPLRHTHITPLAVINIPGATITGSVNEATLSGLAAGAAESLGNGNGSTLPQNATTATGTLVLARIAKGARHQIRVHLAQAGYPIAGDALYGLNNENTLESMPDLEQNAIPERIAGDSGPLFLHHAHITLPGFSASLQPDWPENIWQEHWSKVVQQTARS